MVRLMNGLHKDPSKITLFYLIVNFVLISEQILLKDPQIILFEFYEFVTMGKYCKSFYQSV